VRAGQLAERGEAIGLVPVGSTEQHGPHLPLFTDTLFAAGLADRVADRLPVDVVVTPVISVGLSDHHLAFPGTITLDSETFEAVLVAHFDALKRMGITRIATFSGHGGNFRALGEITARYSQQQPELRVVAYSDLQRFLDLMLEAGRKASVDAPATDVHAGALETSFALILFPELVGPHDDVEGYVDETPGWLERLLAEGTHTLSPNGVLGAPALATEQAGRLVIDELVDELANWIGVSFEIDVPPARDSDIPGTVGGRH
jgi:creatinine amidohydrolase